MAAVLAGCTGPGQRMDVVAARAPGTGAADIRERADVYSINARTLTQLQENEQSAASVRATRPAEFKPYDAPYTYVVGPGDELRVTVFEHPELTNPTGTANELSGRVVNSDGKIFFPYVGAVQAAGRTVQEIQQTITQGLRSVIKNPQVDVSVFRYRSQRVVVSGEVRNPGAVPITDVAPTLGEVISAAGGLTTDADLSNVTVTRGPQTVTADLYGYFYNGEQAQNLRLQSGDVINVPDRRYNKVFVLGEVGRPNTVVAANTVVTGGAGSLVMPRGRYSLAEALGDVGGINPLTANAGQIYVIRGNTGAKPQIFHLNASTPDAMVMADQFNLRRRDVVFVDSVPVVRWSRIVSNILPTADFLRQTLNDTTPGLPR
ncbi:MAG: polysaccharide biosynthesis/export family protein [Burkholderiaceae bacterium]|nr:polysaccharide biosynthesis/export family protein [Burkholderiaceae bacterium]